ncbi:MAG: hypothetical protein HDR50_10595 [Desulfovibrio sp.]|uniref:hypothetical protein n=1 Tax=Desulfovibrio sp. TaxID=885 RepID=UPI001A6795BE|nr:hypothetical protein [Desulfovibrio sp.]MBD5418070.1 hypothetical protein [Desulfovibrio sp.]
MKILMVSFGIPSHQIGFQGPGHLLTQGIGDKMLRKTVKENAKLLRRQAMLKPEFMEYLA